MSTAQEIQPQKELQESRTVQLRDARPSDAAAIAILLAELGYGPSKADVAKSLTNLQRSGDGVIVATQQDRIIGLVTIHRTSFLHRAGDGRLTSIVVAECSHGLGVGRKLVEAAEEIVRAWGCARIEVTCGVQRTAAHQFYEHLGYRHNARRFVKDIE